MNELQFKRWFRSNFEGWSEAYEPRKGGGIGVADIQIAVDRQLVPIELKVGSIIKDRLFPEDVRPAQIGWHHRLADAGIASAFVVGVTSGPVIWGIYAFRPDQIISWRAGFQVNDLVSVRDINKELPEFVRACRKFLFV